MTTLRRYRGLVSAASPPGPAAAPVPGSPERMADAAVPAPSWEAVRPAGPGAPRATRRRRFWTRLDYLIGAACAALIFGVLFHANRGAHFRIAVVPAGAWVLPVLLAIGLSVPVALRRRAPTRSLVVVLIGCLLILALSGQLTRGPFIPLAAVLYLVASTCRRTVALSGLAAALALMTAQGVVLSLAGVGAGNAIGVALLLTIFWMVGYVAQLRRANLAAAAGPGRQRRGDPGTAADRPGTARCGGAQHDRGHGAGRVR